jgi:hypothetical protein
MLMIRKTHFFLLPYRLYNNNNLERDGVGISADTRTAVPRH